METYPKLFAKCPGKQNVWLEVRRVQVVTVPLLVIGASLFHKPDGYAHSQAHAAPWNSLGRGADYVHCLQIATRGQSGDIHMAQGLDWAMQTGSCLSFDGCEQKEHGKRD